MDDYEIFYLYDYHGRLIDRYEDIDELCSALECDEDYLRDRIEDGVPIGAEFYIVTTEPISERLQRV